MKILRAKIGKFTFVNVVKGRGTEAKADYETFAVPGGRRVLKSSLESWAKDNDKVVKYTMGER